MSQVPGRAGKQRLQLVVFDYIQIKSHIPRSHKTSLYPATVTHQAAQYLKNFVRLSTAIKVKNSMPSHQGH